MNKPREINKPALKYIKGIDAQISKPNSQKMRQIPKHIKIIPQNKMRLLIIPPFFYSRTTKIVLYQ